MAICKSIVSDFGVPATYWNIGAVAEDYRGKGCQVTLYGYADEAARRAGKQPLMTGTLAVAPTAYTPDMDRAALYELAKAEDRFAGGEDC
jgi:GNAT superfamily N-acetyltransferase